MEINIAHLLIIFAGGLGFFVANNIRKNKKQADKPFVCPLNFDCKKVVTSKYSTFLGIPLEWLGMAYYGFVVISYFIFILNPALTNDKVVYLVMGASFFAFVMSMYLTYIQAKYIKEWCSWCLFSAFLCSVIFLTALVNVFDLFNTIILF